MIINQTPTYIMGTHYSNYIIYGYWLVTLLAITVIYVAIVITYY